MVSKRRPVSGGSEQCERGLALHIGMLASDQPISDEQARSHVGDEGDHVEPIDS